MAVGVVRWGPHPLADFDCSIFHSNFVAAGSLSLTPHPTPPNRHNRRPPFVVVVARRSSELNTMVALRWSLAYGLLGLLLLPLAAQAGLYRAGSDVLKLTDANFEVRGRGGSRVCVWWGVVGGTKGSGAFAWGRVGACVALDGP